jgi:ABC-type glutathione transport system ATPase component
VRSTASVSRSPAERSSGWSERPDAAKSTTGRIIAGYTTATAGSITVDRQTFDGTKNGLRELRRQVQLISQDPFSSLNPRQTIGAILAAPFRYQKLRPEGGTRRAVQNLLEQVGLRPSDVDRFPAEFSGGQAPASRDRARTRHYSRS